jgi:hypothetical protein
MYGVGFQPNLYFSKYSIETSEALTFLVFHFLTVKTNKYGKFLDEFFFCFHYISFRRLLVVLRKGYILKHDILGTGPYFRTDIANFLTDILNLNRYPSRV